MRTLRLRPVAAMLAAFTAGFSAAAMADNDGNGAENKFAATLSGYHEVHFIAAPTPALRGAISTQASGTFRAAIDDAASTIRYELSYSGLEGEVTQSHIHFGQRHTVGGIVVWLCQTTGTPAPAAVAALTPMCPAEGTVTGTIVAAQVLTATGQGIDAGEFDEVVRAIRAGAAYANVHSTLFPPGEIRGQIHRGDRHRDRDR
jgi:CHRD domain-containing protein